MTLDEFAMLTEKYPRAMSVWNDRMHDLNKGDLIEHLVANMDTKLLTKILVGIEYDISIEEEYDDDE
tara:strand:- start:550 stop:750 length:201 start_codon:yes stop_codon:yes gene_type:complete